MSNHQKFTVPTLVYISLVFHFLNVRFFLVFLLFLLYYFSSSLNYSRYKIFASPKSMTLIYLDSNEGNIKFSGFKSLWQIYFIWQYFIALTICLNKFFALFSEKVVTLSRPSKRSPPLQSLCIYSKMKKINTP
jgi:hypothetical protein